MRTHYNNAEVIPIDSQGGYADGMHLFAHACGTPQ
jgi:hypothetical protein